MPFFVFPVPSAQRVKEQNHQHPNQVHAPELQAKSFFRPAEAKSAKIKIAERITLQQHQYEHSDVDNVPVQQIKEERHFAIHLQCGSKAACFFGKYAEGSERKPEHQQAKEERGRVFADVDEREKSEETTLLGCPGRRVAITVQEAQQDKGGKHQQAAQQHTFFKVRRLEHAAHPIPEQEDAQPGHNRVADDKQAPRTERHRG